VSSNRGSSRPALLALALIAVAGLAIQRSARGSGDDSIEAPIVAVVELPVRAVASVTEAIVDRTAEIFQREELRAELREARARIAQLELTLAEVGEMERENRRLGELLDLRPPTARSGRAARVIARETAAVARSVVIDAGREQGVAIGAAVIAPGGLVGRVVRVGNRTAVVQLVIDPAAGVGALDERSRLQGVLVGAGAAGCRLRYVPNLEDVKPGDLVRASGLDGIYPKGVLIGTVDAVEPGQDAFKIVHVRPAVDFDRLETVLVLQPRDGADPVPGPTQLAAHYGGSTGR